MNTRRGVTLIEMLIAMSIVSCVLLAVVSVLTSSRRLFNNEVGNAESMQEANLAMDLMCQEIGKSIYTGTDMNGDLYIMPPDPAPAAPGGLLGGLIGGVFGYSGSTAVKFYTSDAAGGGPQGSNTSGASTYTNLWRATTTKLNGNPKWQADASWSKQPGGKIMRFPNISRLVFTTAGLPANTVQVSLTVTTKEGGQSSNYTLTRVVYLSNHS